MKISNLIQKEIVIILSKASIVCLLLLFLSISTPCSSKSIENYATIEAYAGKEKVPVYAFGYTYIYGQSPDLLPGVIMQQDNPNLIVKFQPRKSWEIESNLCGLTPTREPKSMWNDDQPLLEIHLIDGDPETKLNADYLILPANTSRTSAGLDMLSLKGK